MCLTHASASKTQHDTHQQLANNNKQKACSKQLTTNAQIATLKNNQQTTVPDTFSNAAGNPCNV